MRPIDADAILKKIKEWEDEYLDFNRFDLGFLTDEAIDKVEYVASLIKKEPTVHLCQQWISVKERLPEQKGKYLVAFHPCYWDNVENKTEVGIDSYRGGNNKHCWARNKYQRVTHWVPFPEPPEESGESDA